MADSPSRIATLSAKISELTAVLDEYHTQNRIPPLDFDENKWNEHQYPQSFERARLHLTDACQELEDLVAGPRKMLRLKLQSTHNFLDVIYTFDLPSRVPRDGKISYGELSKTVGMNESTLKRVIRSAISHRIFRESEPGFVSHSAASRLLLEERKMHDWLGTYLHFLAPTVLKQAAAIQKWPNAGDPSETAFALADVTGSGSFWKFLAADPERARMFASSMTVMSRHDEMRYHHVADNYPWAELGQATVVDLGGSVGDLAFAIASKFPQLKFIVQDLPKTLASAQEKPGVNVTFMEHDYYTPQPVHGADVYIFRRVFHDIGDAAAVRVLQALIPALKSGSRILLVDAVMPDVGSVAVTKERSLRATDLVMGALFNARERELKEWKELLSGADRRFRWRGVEQPKGSKLALIESVWEAD